MFREIIIREMKVQNIKRIDMARNVGIYPASLSDYLNGNKTISSDTVEKILLRLSLYLSKPSIYDVNCINAVKNKFHWTNQTERKEYYEHKKQN